MDNTPMYIITSKAACSCNSEVFRWVPYSLNIAHSIAFTLCAHLTGIQEFKEVSNFATPSLWNIRFGKLSNRLSPPIPAGFSSVLFMVVSVCSGKPLRAPSHLSKVSTLLHFAGFNARTRVCAEVPQMEIVHIKVNTTCTRCTWLVCQGQGGVG